MGGIALVSGATGGIGAAFCRRLAAQGHRLCITGRSHEALERLRQEIESTYAVDVTTFAADLTVRAELEALANAIGEMDVAVLVNNAGLVAPGPFAQVPLARHLALVDVHVMAAMRCCRAALPGMIARGRGTIINVSSLGGFTPDAADVVYGATKRFLIHFTESMAAATAGTGVRVQALCPGLTRTNIHAALGTEMFVPPMFWMDPDAVVGASFDALAGGRVICVPGRLNRVMRRLLPYPRVVRRVMAAGSAIARRRGWNRPARG